MATPFLPAGATTGDSGGELSSGDDSGDMESFQTPEAEATRSLAELFEKAAAHVQGLVQVASREQLLYLYARYKQTRSHCVPAQPGGCCIDMEGPELIALTAQSSTCPCCRSKLEIAIFLNQTSLILKESKNGRHGKPSATQALAKQCRNISRQLKN